MSNTEIVDGFDYDDPDDSGSGRKLIQGIKIRFTNEGDWIDSNENEIPADLELIPADKERVLQKWGTNGGAPLETRFLAPTEKKPDVEAMNAALPKSEWRKDFNGNLKGPWEFSWVLYFFDPLTGTKYTYLTNTTGGNMAIGDLSEKTKNIRRLRGDHVYPVVTLTDEFMNTKWGGRQRPSFRVVRWVRFEGGNNAALPAPEPRPLPPVGAAEKKTPTSPAKKDDAGMTTVDAPSIQEEIDDEVPF